MNKKLAYIIATFFGVGYCPVASGTAGSLATLPIAFLLYFYCGGLPAILAFFVLVYVAGTFASKEVLKYTSHDPSIIVIDEVAGQLIPLIFFFALTDPPLYEVSSGVDFDWTEICWWWVCIILPCFVFFRIFDILKPFPANYFDKKVLNAHGVMLDDIVAGIYVLVAFYVFALLSIPFSLEYSSHNLFFIEMDDLVFYLAALLSKISGY